MKLISRLREAAAKCLLPSEDRPGWALGYYVGPVVPKTKSGPSADTKHTP